MSDTHRNIASVVDTLQDERGVKVLAVNSELTNRDIQNGRHEFQITVSVPVHKRLDTDDA